MENKESHAYTYTEDPEEWIQDCIHCPLPDCVDCRSTAPREWLDRPLRGCIDTEVFIQCYNRRDTLQTIARRVDIPMRFLRPFVEGLGLPWKRYRGRPDLTREYINELPDNARALFG